MGEPFTTACTRIEAKPVGLWQQTGCRTPTTPPPADFFPPLLGEGVAAERNATQLSDAGADGSLALRQSRSSTHLALVSASPSTPTACLSEAR